MQNRNLILGASYKRKFFTIKCERACFHVYKKCVLWKTSENIYDTLEKIITSRLRIQAHQYAAIILNFKSHKKKKTMYIGIYNIYIMVSLISDTQRI